MGTMVSWEGMGLHGEGGEQEGRGGEGEEDDVDECISDDDVECAFDDTDGWCCIINDECELGFRV